MQDTTITAAEAVAAVGKNADRQQAPQAGHAMHGNRPGRIVNAAALQDEHFAAGPCEIGGGDQAVVAPADDDGIVFWHDLQI